MSAQLSLGPVLFNWKADDWRDFYFRIADEADVDTVYVGEAVCSKRTPFYSPHMPDVIERLQAAGKEVILSTLALIMNKREMKELRETVASCGEGAGLMVEANDVSACALLAGRPHAIGPYVNVYNEGTLKYFTDRGAARVCLPVELGRDAMRALVADTPAALEVQVFGRLPLAISARCYHARAHMLHKDSCQFVCERDPDGLEVETLDHEPFLAVNGVQTMSHSYQNLSAELAEMQAIGIRHFRLSPHTCDMVAVAAAYRALLNANLSPEEADDRLGELVGDAPFSNGYYHGAKGVDFVLSNPE